MEPEGKITESEEQGNRKEKLQNRKQDCVTLRNCFRKKERLRNRKERLRKRGGWIKATGRICSRVKGVKGVKITIKGKMSRVAKSDGYI